MCLCAPLYCCHFSLSAIASQFAVFLSHFYYPCGIIMCVCLSACSARLYVLLCVCVCAHVSVLCDYFHIPTPNLNIHIDLRIVYRAMLKNHEFWSNAFSWYILSMARKCIGKSLYKAMPAVLVKMRCFSNQSGVYIISLRLSI